MAEPLTNNNNNADSTILNQTNQVTDVLSEKLELPTIEIGDKLIIETKHENIKRRLVLDTGAFLRGENLEKLSLEADLYTVQEVISEIKDANARSRLDAGLFKLIIRDPHPNDYKEVVTFAKKTGDYASLSLTDLKVIALAYMLERELNGVTHLNKEPIKMTAQAPYTVQKKKKKKKKKPQDNVTNKELPLENNIKYNIKEQVIVSDTDKSISDNINEKVDTSKPDNIEFSNKNDNSELEKPYDIIEKEKNITEVNDEDEEGWITLDNITEVTEKLQTAKLGSATVKKPHNVGCITSDYSIQNLLLQIGLKLVSINGLQIKQIKQWSLRCISCFKLCRNMEKIFCPNCGNNTLTKVAISVNDKGEIHQHTVRRFSALKGTIYSLPLPKGGRSEVKIITCEDQLPRKKRYQELAAFDPDRTFFNSKKSTDKETKYIIAGSRRNNPNQAKRLIHAKRNTP